MQQSPRLLFSAVPHQPRLHGFGLFRDPRQLCQCFKRSCPDRGSGSAGMPWGGWERVVIPADGTQPLWLCQSSANAGPWHPAASQGKGVDWGRC